MLENIIFDLGGVLLNIDMDKTRSAFIKLGWLEEDWKGIVQSGNPLFANLEEGLSSSVQFRNNIRKLLPGNPSDDEIDNAWNAMLLDFPPGRVDYLLELRRSYRLYLFSNTNELHLHRFRDIFEHTFGYPLHRLFEKCYFSHVIGSRKPNPEAFQKVLKDACLDPEKTLFVDDLKPNTDAAEGLGMKVLHIEAGTLLLRLPKYLKQFAD